MGMSERGEIIAEMREYFEQRADAEYLPGSPDGSPNEEMTMLWKLDRLQASLESHHRDLLAIHRVASRIAGVEPPTEDDTLTVKRVKQMAMMINQLSDGQAAREQEGESEWLIQLRGDYLATRGIWERPSHCGYTNDIHEAGRFSEEDANKSEAMAPHKYKAVRLPASHPPQSKGVPEEYRQALQDAFDIIQADANTEENYGSLCRIGSVLSKISTPAAPQSQGAPEGFYCNAAICNGCGHVYMERPSSCDCGNDERINGFEPAAVFTAADLSTPAAPQADEIEPDLLWDYDNGDDSGQDSAYELADYCAQDLPHGETIEVVVMCAKRLPNRHMKIWVDEDDDVQWEWISPKPPEQGDGV